MVTKEQIIQDIKNVATVLKKPPSKKEYTQNSKYSFQTVINKFGGFNEAVMIAIGSVNYIHPDKIKINCSYCGKTLFRQPSSIISNNVFCNRSCSAKYNNKHYPKRTKTKKCKTCSQLIYNSHKYCKKCISQNKHVKRYLDIENKTIAYFKNLRNDSSRYTYIRQHARRITSHLPQACQNCGYDKHVEVCHIKEIKDFQPQTKIKTVNHPNNLILLCPNCHWELDH